MIQEKLIIVTPVFNDYQALEFLVNDLISYSIESSIPIHLVVVDDCSVRVCPSKILGLNGKLNIEILKLGTNMGHQRAIAVGLCHAYTNNNYFGVLVMDSDGEDRVQDIRHLLRRSSNNNIVVATRKSRSETYIFKSFYSIYKLIFLILAGREIDFGNFMFIPASRLEPLIYMPDIWNHLAASILKSKIPFEKVGISRGKRYCGKSNMNFHNLTVHGLGAMAVFVDHIYSRILTFLIFLVFLFVLLMAIALYIRICTDLAIPGWATTVIGFLILAIMQSLLIMFVSMFTVLSSRSTKQVVPIHEFKLYVVSHSVKSSSNSSYL